MKRNILCDTVIENLLKVNCNPVRLHSSPPFSFHVFRNQEELQDPIIKNLNIFYGFYVFVMP